MSTLATTTHLLHPAASARVQVRNGTSYLHPTVDGEPMLGICISHNVGELSAVLRAWAELVDRAEAQARVVQVVA